MHRTIEEIAEAATYDVELGAHLQQPEDMASAPPQGPEPPPPPPPPPQNDEPGGRLR